MHSIAQGSASCRSATIRDSEIGVIVREQRLAKGLTQTELGQHVGVTFQQIQKYENGSSRISSGRLQRIAEVLDIPVATFFVSDTSAKPGDAAPSLVDEMMNTDGAIRLLQAFQKISDVASRKALITIAKSLAN